jgi:hypothetical protein
MKPKTFGDRCIVGVIWLIVAVTFAALVYISVPPK